MLDWDVPLLTIRLLIHRSWTQTYTSLAHLGNPFQDGGMNPSPSHLPAVFTHVPPLKWSKVLRARWSAQAWDVPRDEIDVNMSSIEFPNALILNLDYIPIGSMVLVYMLT